MRRFVVGLVVVLIVAGLWGSDSTVTAQSGCASQGAVSDATNNPGLVSDCETLLAARDSLAGTASLNWSANRSITQWDGVTVGGTPQRITRLYLGINQLNGTIPPELGSLSSLKELDLYNNRLSGTIPSELGSLPSLELLNISSNRLSGTMPPELGSLSNLEWLRLGGNRLSGTIPSELSSLSNLKELNLWGNQLSGTIPPELGSLPNLQTLWLWNNQLSGTIPASLGSLSNLEVLELWNNQLIGTIPASLGNLANLELLSLSSNQLSGTIPPELGSLSNLRVLYFSGNKLSGCIPAGLRDVPTNDLANLGLPYCDVLLSRLSINPGLLTPSFDPYHDSYTASSTESVVTLTVSSDHNAIVQFQDATGAELLDADLTQAGHQVSLASGGVTTARIEVHSQDGLSSHTYTIRIAPPPPEAIRAFSATSVAIGGQLVVTIEVSNYGPVGFITEMLPAGFGYVSSNLTATSVTGQQVEFALFGENGFTYTVTASRTPGTYSFSGVLRDFAQVDHQIGGASSITVGDSPGVQLTVSGKPLVRIDSPITVTASFSEPVNGFTVADVTVANGDVSNFVGSDGDSVFTFDVTPNAIGAVTVDIADGVAESYEGSGNTAAVQLVLGLPYDDDHDGAIGPSEVLTAVSDYFSGRLSAQHILEVVALYFQS